MSARRITVPLLIAGQFILLGLDLLVAVLESLFERSHGPFVPPLLIGAHIFLLMVLIRRLGQQRREQMARLRAMNRRLQQALRRAQDLTECSSDLVYETDAQGRFTFISDHNGVKRDTPGIHLGMSIAELRAMDPVTPSSIWEEQIASTLEGKPFRDFQYSVRRTDGRIAYFRVNGVPVRAESGELLGFRGTTRDRTAEVEAMQTLNFQAMHDTLTGLPNRRSIYATMDRYLDPQKGSLAVLLLDLDGFKLVNDLHGHAAGDELLRLVAARLREAVRPGDLVGRLGGDEFAAILAGGDQASAQAVGERILASLSLPFTLDGGTTARIGVSIGVALAPDHGGHPDALMRFADQALYACKHQGGGGLRLPGAPEANKPPAREAPSPALEELRSAATLSAELRLAQERGEFSLVYQPILRCRDGSVAIMETLLRWNSRERGPVPPDVFIPAAEESGLIVPMGAWVLREACQAAARAGGSWRLAVNISPVQFQQPDLGPMIAGILHDSGLAPERLVLELTERMLIHSFSAARETMRRLRAMGVSLALDDFGVGYSNVSCLREFRFDIVKLDRSMLALPAEQRDLVLRSLLGVAQAFRLETVVEGVESAEDWALLRRIGFDGGQGYHLGRPSLSLTAEPAEAAPAPG